MARKSIYINAELVVKKNARYGFIKSEHVIVTDANKRKDSHGNYVVKVVTKDGKYEGYIPTNYLK